VRSRRLPLPARAVYERVITHLRAVARTHGYALAVHGSLGRDVDLLAAPWVEGASTPEELAEALRAGAETVLGAAYILRPGAEKPHGRRAWTFYYHDYPGTWIDLSVFPPL
jgi:hypothetical protein